VTGKQFLVARRSGAVCVVLDKGSAPQPWSVGWEPTRPDLFHPQRPVLVTVRRVLGSSGHVAMAMGGRKGWGARWEAVENVNGRVRSEAPAV
jgi:hypothetical protein